VEKIEFIDDYLNGKLSEDESELLEEHLIECDRCSKILEERVILKEIIHRNSKEIFEGLVTEERIDSPSSIFSPLLSYMQRVKRPGVRWGIAAAATCIILLVPLVLIRDIRRDPRRLAAIEVYPYTTPFFRGNTHTENILWKFNKGIAYYQNGEYAEALPFLEDAREQNDDNPEISFFLGVCYLLTGHETKAAAAFESVISKIPDWEPGHWYLANSRLKAGEVRKALESLEKVITFEGRYARDALQLKEQILERIGEEKYD
jgi:tetratricopeptide (TPR) repeat protein